MRWLDQMIRMRIKRIPKQSFVLDVILQVRHMSL